MSSRATPPRHFRPQSQRQRRADLARIDATEREALQSAPIPLTADPYLLRTPADSAVAVDRQGPTRAPLRLIKPTLLKQPARALEPMPMVDHKLRRVVWISLLIYVVCAVVAVGIWSFTR